MLSNLFTLALCSSVENTECSFNAASGSFLVVIFFNGQRRIRIDFSSIVVTKKMAGQYLSSSRSRPTDLEILIELVRNKTLLHNSTHSAKKKKKRLKEKLLISTLNAWKSTLKRKRVNFIFLSLSSLLRYFSVGRMRANVPSLHFWRPHPPIRLCGVAWKTEIQPFLNY